MHAWRAALLKAFGAKMGRDCHVYAKAKIWAPWNLVIADEGAVGDDATLYSMATITIGKRAVISQGVHLCTGTHDYTDPAFRLFAKPIEVGEDAWVCAEAFVGPGVKIGDGAVIGARSVVLRDMPAWTVCSGHPCSPRKPRIINGGGDATR
jgi:putative colanic acid biosynthesis acetyltransferase WcaF